MRCTPAIWFEHLATIFMLAATGCSSTTAVDADADAGNAADTDTSTATLTLASTAFEDQGTLPVVYTCDGAGLSPPLAWTGVPDGTIELALLMTTLANDGMKWNWVLYGMAAGVTSLAEGSTGVGKFGLTSDGPELAYSPPCSQGPGAKTYTFTIYALSEPPVLDLPANEITGAVLTNAISEITLASSKLKVTYTR
jgi:phosphatidylethanolamine-binding protein (PEBP) family uncharacterized protein